jgi:dephospho-CoA kinase
MTKGITIGLTGNSGAGKGEAAIFMNQRGAYIINADILAHESMKKGQPAYEAIVLTFGGSILDAGGEIDRKVLGAVVYNDREKKHLLESIVHSEVRLKADRATNGAFSNGYLFVVWDAPLLIEAGMHKMCDAVILLTAPLNVKANRIIARDDISADLAELRLRNQHDETTLLEILKLDIAPQQIFIINNDAGLDALRENIARVLDSLNLTRTLT